MPLGRAQHGKQLGISTMAPAERYTHTNVNQSGYHTYSNEIILDPTHVKQGEMKQEIKGKNMGDEYGHWLVSKNEQTLKSLPITRHFLNLVS